MHKISLLVEDDYIQTLIEILPKDKVIVVEEDFEQNKLLLRDTLMKYKDDKDSFTPFLKSMQSLNSWLKEREL